MFSFVHAADLHLGCPFRGIEKVKPEVAAALRQATYTAFNRIIDLAIRSQSAFVLFAGDIYNSGEGNLKARLAFRDGIARLHDAGIHSFIIRGNHDPLDDVSRKATWPDTCWVFPDTGAEPQAVRANGDVLAVVYGLSFGRAKEEDNLARLYPRLGSGPLRVALLHCNCGAVTGHDPYAPCTLDDLTDSSFDYWALGHIHKPGVLRDSGPSVVYAGSSQGLDPSETGPRGCYLVQVDEHGKATPAFREVAPVRWEWLSQEIAGLEKEDQLIDALSARVDATRREAEDRSVLLRISLIGRGPMHDWAQDPSNLEVLSERLSRLDAGSQFCWIESIRSQTRPDIDLQERALAGDLLGDFLTLADEIAGLEAVPRSLLDTLKKVSGEVARVTDQERAPAPDQVRQWVEAARILGAGLLSGGE
jgi:DNA repair exonuclease SbcCD nuclease subunit